MANFAPAYLKGNKQSEDAVAAWQAANVPYAQQMQAKMKAQRDAIAAQLLANEIAQRAPQLPGAGAGPFFGSGFAGLPPPAGDPLGAGVSGPDAGGGGIGTGTGTGTGIGTGTGTGGGVTTGGGPTPSTDVNTGGALSSVGIMATGNSPAAYDTTETGGMPAGFSMGNVAPGYGLPGQGGIPGSGNIAQSQSQPATTPDEDAANAAAANTAAQNAGALVASAAPIAPTSVPTESVVAPSPIAAPSPPAPPDTPDEQADNDPGGHTNTSTAEALGALATAGYGALFGSPTAPTDQAAQAANAAANVGMINAQGNVQDSQATMAAINEGLAANAPASTPDFGMGGLAAQQGGAQSITAPDFGAVTDFGGSNASVGNFGYSFDSQGNLVSDVGPISAPASMTDFGEDQSGEGEGTSGGNAAAAAVSDAVAAGDVAGAAAAADAAGMGAAAAADAAAAAADAASGEGGGDGGE